jgi:hypothetical protein
MIARVSNLESFRRWRKNEEASLQDFLDSLAAPPSGKMLAGTAFHEFLEHGVSEGKRDSFEIDGFTAGGFTFSFRCDCVVPLAPVRELRAYKYYDTLKITGKVDAMHGLAVFDHKTTRKFDAESYLEGYQWRYYLDIFNAENFIWNIFVVKPLDDEETTFDVVAQHKLSACRYHGLHDDCLALARDYYEVMKNVPDGSMLSQKAEIEGIDYD